MGKPLALLQVEDSASDAALVVRLLERAGYDVHSERVETAAQMRAAVQRRPWDAILADYQLPQFDAPSALALLRESGLDLPFIVISGALGEERAVAMMKAGAHDYVMKDDLRRLVPAVEREIHEAGVRRDRALGDEALRGAREETERSHQLLDAIFRAQTDAIVVCDTAGGVVHSNPAAWALFGFNPDGNGMMDLLGELHVPAGPGQSTTRRALAGETVVNLEQTTPKGTFESSSLPIRDPAGRIIGAVTIMRDITERKRAEQRLQQAQKLESIALLAGGIAHDFNNILTVVAGNISLALQEACPTCDTRSTLMPAMESVKRASSLTRQLLAYAGKGAFIRKPVSVSEAGEQTVAALRPSLPDGVRLVADFVAAPSPLFMDPGQLEQVFSNLILNATEAIPEGRPGLVTVRTACEADSVRIEVCDNGCGIDAEARDKIFEPFFTTKFAGRGLGLAAVEGIVRTLHGVIGVESEVGRGTRIEVTLPVRRAAAPSPAVAAPVPVSAGAEGTVLLVDDEPSVLKMAGAFLRKQGIPVLEASNGHEAIERLGAAGDSVRVVVLDLAMPGMPGEVALPVIRKMRPDVRVIISSGFHDRDVEEHFGNGRLCSFLPKPYNLDQLRDAVMQAVHERA